MKKQSAVALLFVVPALALGACGGDSDKDKITTLIKDVNSDPTKLCDNATQNLIKEIGGEKACRKIGPNDDSEQTDVKVESVDVNGDKATATVSSKINGKEDKNQKGKLVKEDGDWKLDSE